MHSVYGHVTACSRGTTFSRLVHFSDCSDPIFLLQRCFVFFTCVFSLVAALVCDYHDYASMDDMGAILCMSFFLLDLGSRGKRGVFFSQLYYYFDMSTLLIPC